MPITVWENNEDKKLKKIQFDLAKKYLQGRSNGTMLKRSKNNKPIIYQHPKTQQKITLSHSFSIYQGQILAIAGKGAYLGKGRYGRVKLAESEQGQLYALKFSRFEDVKENEISIASDIGICHGKYSVYEINIHEKINLRADKSLTIFNYLGVSLHKYHFKDQNQKIAIALKIVRQLYKLHQGELSNDANKHRYIHCDLKGDNIVFDEEKNEIHLVDFGLSIEADDNLVGLTTAHQNLSISKKSWHFAPETLNGECQFSFLSDYYQLGIVLNQMNIPKLQTLAEKLQDQSIHKRPHLKLCELVILQKIHQNNDHALVLDLKKYNCLTDDILLVKLITLGLTSNVGAFQTELISALNLLIFSGVLIDQDLFETLRQSILLQKTIITLVSVNQFKADDFDDIKNKIML